MKKQTENTNREYRTEELIQKTMNREFPLPESVEKAKGKAFAQIRKQQAQAEEEYRAEENVQKIVQLDTEKENRFAGTGEGMNPGSAAAENRSAGNEEQKIGGFCQEAERKQEQANRIAEAGKQRRRKQTAVMKSLAGIAAAAAVFTVVCISNPALAAGIPLVGHLFEELGSQLGYSGDYGKYIQVLETNETESGSDAAAENAESSAAGSDAETENADGTSAGSEAASENADSSAEMRSDTAAENADGEEEMDDTNGTGNSAEEGAAVNVAVETATDTAEASDSAESDAQATAQAASAGKYTQTYNGMTVTLSEIYCNDSALYVSLLLTSEEPLPDTITDQNGKPVIYTEGSVTSPDVELNLDHSTDSLDGELVDEYTFAGVLRVDLTTASTDLPEEFTVNLGIERVIGDRAESLEMPEMPQEYLDAYNEGLREAGIDVDNLDLDSIDYETLTDEQKETGHQLYTEMMNKYWEKYPDTNGIVNKYESWWYEGDWNFEIAVTRNDEDTVVKEINDIDENGIGVNSVTKTPFEITVDAETGDAVTWMAILDADGNALEGGGSTGTDSVVAINGADVSKIDIYICDWDSYMDIKGLRLDDNIEDSEYDTFKQALEETASLHHTEVVFEE